PNTFDLSDRRGTLPTSTARETLPIFEATLGRPQRALDITPTQHPPTATLVRIAEFPSASEAHQIRVPLLRGVVFNQTREPDKGNLRADLREASLHVPSPTITQHPPLSLTARVEGPAAQHLDTSRGANPNLLQSAFSLKAPVVSTSPEITPTTTRNITT